MLFYDFAKLAFLVSSFRERRGISGLLLNQLGVIAQAAFIKFTVADSPAHGTPRRRLPPIRSRHPKPCWCICLYRCSLPWCRCTTWPLSARCWCRSPVMAWPILAMSCSPAAGRGTRCWASSPRSRTTICTMRKVRAHGFYFTFWDRVMGTEHPEYLERFERATENGVSGAVVEPV